MTVRYLSAFFTSVCFVCFFLYTRNYFEKLESISVLQGINYKFISEVSFLFIFFSIIVFIYLVFTNFKLGLTVLIIYLPMAALPFIMLGIPRFYLNNVFVFRSSIIFFTLIISFKWFFSKVHLHSHSYLKNNSLLFTSICLMFCFYLFNIYRIDRELIMGAFQSLIVFTSCIIFFYFLLSYVNSIDILINTIRLMVYSCLIQAVLSLLDTIYYGGLLGAKEVRVGGLFRGFETFAEYLAIHVPLIFCLIRRTEHFLKKKMLIAGLFIMIFTLFTTETRGALLSLFCGCTFYLLLMRRLITFSKTVKIIFISIIACSILLYVLPIIFPASSHILERFIHTKNVTSFDTRGPVWHRFFEYFPEKPILGYGMVYDWGNYKYKPGTKYTYYFWPHSTYFSYLLTMGITGLLAYLTVLFGIIQKSISNLRLNKNSLLNYELSATLSSSLVIFVIDNFKIEYLRYTNYQLFIWLLFALIVSLNRISRPC